MKKLIKIQAELKAPKNQFNAFGKYKYRNAEDILEAVKPLLVREGLLMTISDTIEQVGNRIYVKATVCVRDGEIQHCVSAYARESETRKGMDESQLTGATSSYARKYALNGMFCIDDTKDADTMDNRDQGKKKLPELTMGCEKWETIVKHIANGGSIDDVKKKYTVSDDVAKELIIQSENL